MTNQTNSGMSKQGTDGERDPSVCDMQGESLRKALHDAATSLETISLTAGTGEFMESHREVRGYAASRAQVARAALAERTQQEAVAPHLGDTFEPTMDIYAQPGTVVRFRAGGGYEGERKRAVEAGFVKNNLYTVKRCDIGGSRTDVLFDEIPGHWNSCLFADVAARPSSAADCTAPPDHKCGDAAIGVLQAIDRALHDSTAAEILDENSPIRDAMRDVLKTVAGRFDCKAPMQPSDEQLGKLARSMNCYGLGSRNKDAVAFARAVLALATPAPTQAAPFDLDSYNKGWDGAMESMRNVAAVLDEATSAAPQQAALEGTPLYEWGFSAGKAFQKERAAAHAAVDTEIWREQAAAEMMNRAAAVDLTAENQSRESWKERAQRGAPAAAVEPMSEAEIAERGRIFSVGYRAGQEDRAAAAPEGLTEDQFLDAVATALNDYEAEKIGLHGVYDRILALRASDDAKTAAVDGRFSVAVGLLQKCLGPLEASAAIIESDDTDEMEKLIEHVRKFVSDAITGMQLRPASGDAKDAGALRNLYRAYVRLLETGRDRIMDLGGQCDPVDVMEQRDPNLIEARAAIATQEGGHD